ncbi:MAG: hypothetical protein JOY90_06345 [Bradyrhizobium sp.]|uniref:hypothetical protein n=1 Tax=Bradyrhizobium sp. TaxID=376 RepID=UPI001D9C9A58|nr:hypothetical protein [Bradyrhizobium sp.]MBV9560069.1 hypothetical protein [Bradyrhizobium sp.]
MSCVTDDGPDIVKDRRTVEIQFMEVTMLTLSRLDAIDADRLRRKLDRTWRIGKEGLARRRYRLMCRVHLHLHKALMADHRTVGYSDALAS